MDSAQGAVTEYFVFHRSRLFVAQLLCVGPPLLYVVMVRPFKEWFKNVSSVIVYCATIFAVAASVSPQYARTPLSYVIVLLMLLFLVGMLAIPLVRYVRLRSPERTRYDQCEKSTWVSHDKHIDFYCTALLVMLPVM